MTAQVLLQCVSDLLTNAGVQQGMLFHESSGTHLLRYQASSGLNSTVYHPLLCLVLQGAKQVGASDKMLTVRAGQSVIASHTLPVVSRITEASPDLPYVALVFPLDLDLLRSLSPSISGVQLSSKRSKDSFSICRCETNQDIEDALCRYFSQCRSDATRNLLAPITRREIHARLLLSEHSEMLHRLLWHESTASRIFQATQDIQANLAKNIAIGDLAQRVGMSNSTFFEQFKVVTGTSPLQYQKELRLLHARDELHTPSAKVSEIAFAVGYESLAQFSREYTRKFGRSPRQDRQLAHVA
ncbi:AraC family transcriptional regulator [Thiolinea disciformis]|uniref:AraC family transcriptional regulator n=1 Tax=Thiolinea disciformis TaxID=125614 RepID=UPI00037EDC2D|nr:AraC family transcriptional regulator [Thiolinea disciformis]